MPRYIVERYVPSLDPGDLPREVARIGEVISKLADQGLDVRLVRSVLVPADETCFHHLEMGADAIGALRRLAGLAEDRVTEAIE